MFLFQQNYEGEDTTYIIGNKDWNHTNLFDTIIDGQKVSTIIDESKNMATMRGEECGILVHYMFKKSNGTWILHKIIDSTNQKACVDLQSPHIHATKQDKGLQPQFFNVAQNIQGSTKLH